MWHCDYCGKYHISARTKYVRQCRQLSGKVVTLTTCVRGVYEPLESLSKITGDSEDILFWQALDNDSFKSITRFGRDIKDSVRRKLIRHIST